ncbi:SCO4848 family membrane protein [Humidisolicoccus flavus]|uniref:SCO4848 family membrane protein n=1 Tax=Humidisolicoccus flavus TaxID=3111414 RepID=UPI003244F93F
MIATLAALLIANAVFNAIVWPLFLRRVIRDPRAKNAQGKATPFLTVHIVLVSIALALALASLLAALVTLTDNWG